MLITDILRPNVLYLSSSMNEIGIQDLYLIKRPSSFATRYGMQQRRIVGWEASDEPAGEEFWTSVLQIV